MESLTLVIGQDASGAFYPGHFGDADRFAAYTLRADGTLEAGRVVANSSKTLDETHGAKGKMKAVLATLAPLHCVVAAQASPNFKRMARAAPIQPVVVCCASDDLLLPCLARECANLMEWVDRRRRGDPLTDVPVLEAAPSQPSPRP